MSGSPLQPLSPHWQRPTQPPANSVTYTQSEREGGVGGGGGPLGGRGYSHGHGNGLPPLKFSDSAFKERRDTSDADQKNVVTMAAITSASALASPNNMYSGPPPPYYASPASAPHSFAGFQSPTDPRRLPEGERESSRQSLPSIHEALGKEPPNLFASAAPQAANIPYISPSHPPPAASPTGLKLRSHPEPILSGPPNPYAPTSASSLPPYSNESQETRPPPTPRQDSTHDDLQAANARKSLNEPPLSAHTTSTASPIAPIGQSPRSMHFPHSSPMYPPSTHGVVPVPAPAYHTFPPPSTSFPPPSKPSYGYPHSYPPQPWRTEGPPEVERAEEVRKAAAKKSPGSGQHYGESVKRHLDIFDIETSLNEIAEGCGRALDFARHYGQRAHQTQRSGPTTASMPSLIDCDDMLRRQKLVLDSMSRIREVVLAQQTAMAEQASRDEANKTHQPDYSEESYSYADKLDGAGGFAGADAKKRRGRNAPPGRCHSCNRAETPEWRRGPDGARTLCNACGLHYAKLTRKHGAKAGLGTSNLRPKENGSP